MKSITIHKIDKPLADLIVSKAKTEGLSINKTVKKILEESLGVKPRSNAIFMRDFEEFCGIWSEADLAEFSSRTKDFDRVDPEDWQ
jgi:hypothetical protein